VVQGKFGNVVREYYFWFIKKFNHISDTVAR